MSAVRRLSFILVLCAAFVLLGFSAARAQQPPSALVPGSDPGVQSILSHYVVFEQNDQGAISPVFYRQVMVNSAFFDSAGETYGAARLTDAIRVSLVQRDGSAVFETTADAPRWVRGEFHGESVGAEAAIDGHRFASNRSAFVVRAPVMPETRLVLRDDEAGVSQAFDLEALAADSTLPLFAPSISRLSPLGALDGGPSANRVDLLIMGDGYATGQESLFNTHVSAFAADFFGITPYAEYRPFVKLASLFTPSPQSGADHPP
ncbi:MAG: hypothetical protein JNL42_10890, partial [Anaerolineae bacterium]|nr:hypothetical protein [Anaerolineae bacterium]